MTDEHDGERERGDTSHLDGIDDGCGCAEVWEHLSEGRETGSGAERDADPGHEDAAGDDVQRGVEGGGVAVDTSES